MEGTLRSPSFPSARGCLSEPAVLGAEGSLRPKSTLPCAREVLAWEGGNASIQDPGHFPALSVRVKCGSGGRGPGRTGTPTGQTVVLWACFGGGGPTLWTTYTYVQSDSKGKQDADSDVAHTAIYVKNICLYVHRISLGGAA